MGTGGTGGYFGGLLAKAGEDVAFVARGFHLEVIRSRGLTVKSPIAGYFTLRVKATHNPQEIRGPVDVVLFCVKTYDTIAAAELIHPIIGPKTVVLSVQNGIDNEECITQIVGEQAVIGAVAQVTALVEAPGVVAQTAGPGRILLGELTGGNSSRTEKLQRIFQRAGIATELHPDIRIALWDKFVFICAFSGITAFTRLPLGPLRAYQETRVLLREVMVEVESVARTKGIALPADCVERNFAWLNTYGEPHAYGSMYFDLAANRRLELEDLNGTAVRLGREQHIPTPLNFAIYAALKPYAEGAPTLPSM
jgi:2-dehydropantoate 2-reductase